MRYLLLTLLMFFPALASAQELHTFSNGEVADAEKINENFEALKSEISGSGGCSAQQDGSSVVITCADGTSGVLASAGTVVLLPEATVSPIDDSTIIGGNFYVVDAEGTALAEWTSGTGPVFEIKFPGLIYRFFLENDDASQTVNLYSSTNGVMFATEDCTGVGFFDRLTSFASQIGDKFYGRSGGQYDVILRSSMGIDETCYPFDAPRPTNGAYSVAEINIPEEVRNPVYPVSVEQI